MTPTPPVFPLFQDIRALLGTFPCPAGPDVGQGEAVHGQGEAVHGQAALQGTACLRSSPRAEPALPVLPERMVAELGEETNHLTKPYRYI